MEDKNYPFEGGQMNLNINTSDSEHLNQEIRDKQDRNLNPVQKEILDTVGNQPNNENSYIVLEKGHKVQRWFDKAGHWHEKIL